MTAPARPDPLKVECDRCGARPGAVCRVCPSWKRASKPHAARVRLAEKEDK